MRIVIDIPAQVYGTLKYFESALNGIEPSDIKSALIVAVLHGNVLPQGHGRLIDADPIMEGLREMTVVDEKDKQNVRFATLVLEHAPTIIEADKEV